MSKRQRNQRGEGPRLRLEIIQAAMRILDRAPATQLSLRMVAREAGISPTAVYAHFSDAHAMMSAIIHECWRQLAEEMGRAARDVPALDSFASLRAQISAYVHYAMGSPSRYQLLFALHPGDPEASRYIPRPAEPVYLRMLELMDRLRAEDHPFPVADTHSATLLILTITHGRIALAHTSLSRPFNAPDQVEIFVLELIEKLFRPAN